MSKVLIISLCLQAQAYYCVMNESVRVFLDMLIDKADVYKQIYGEYIVNMKKMNYQNSY